MHERERTINSSQFGRLLRRYRLAAGLSQEALAERARMSADGVSALERGHRRSPQRETLALLAAGLALNDEQRLELEAAAARRGLPRGEASVTVGPWAGATEVNLPLALTAFIGRDRELREIGELVRKHRLITVTGAGGVGKTQTALHVAASLGENEGATCFVGLASVADPGLVQAAVAAVLRLQETPNRPLLETLVAYLKHKVLLLLLDNCEHVAAEAASVAERLLANCPGLRILATSREPLMADGERRYQLRSLNDEEAVELFVDRAQAVDARFVLTDKNAPIVAEICRKLGRIPLGIELAAARVNVLSLAALRDRLNESFRVLTGGRSRTSARWRSLQAMIDWSYDMLAPNEQRAFERLSVFAGGAPLSAAATVCTDGHVAESAVLDLLAALVDKSLVAADLERSEPRYGLLESFRAYAREKLTLRGETQTVARAHASACLRLAEQLSVQRGNEPIEVSHDRWFVEQDNFRCAVQWALMERHNVPLGQQLAGEISYWEFFAAGERQRWMAAAMALVDASTPASVRASLQRANAIVAFHLRDYETSLASSEVALAKYRALGDATGVAQVLNAKGYALSNLRRNAEARATFEEGLVVARAAKSKTALAGILAGLAIVSDDAAANRRYLSEARQIHQASGNKVGVVYTMLSQGICEERAGDPELALMHATDALGAAADVPAFAGVNLTMLALLNMSEDLLSLGKYDEAAQRTRRRLELACEYGVDHHIDTSLELLATIAIFKCEALEESSHEPLARAARLLGFVDARFAAAGQQRYETSKPRYDRALALLCEALGSDRAAALTLQGANLPLDEAVAQVPAICPA